MIQTFFCGPLAVQVDVAETRLQRKIREMLDLYNVRWTTPHARIALHGDAHALPSAPARGSFLTCARTRVDSTADGLYATCDSGSFARYAAADQCWRITVRANSADALPEDVEDLVTLALTTGWRERRWVPLHAAAVSNGAVCALLCAASGGGKTTLSAALIRRGWQTLGDDKLLLQWNTAERGAEVHAVLHTFNLHPNTREWFPEVGDLTQLPQYSAWTEKRRVPVEDIWPGRTARYARPTHLIQIERDDAATALQVTRLDPSQTLDALLRQTVIPAERAVAAPILAALVPTARQLTGLRLVVPRAIFRDQDCLAVLEAALA